jgi:hypothetical protein
MQEKQPTRLSRRSFFGAFGGASTAAVAAVTMLRPDTAEAYDPGEAETAPRYRETDHVKEYYRVNRYPAAKG